MITLAIDASMTRTGWSLIRDNDLLDFGFVIPKGDTYLDKAEHTAFQLQSDVGAVADIVDIVIIEEIKGRHVGSNASISSLISLAQFVTALSMKLKDALDVGVELVPPSKWTRSRKKEVRQKQLLLTCPEYADWLKDNKDSGCDVADAIELNQWWWDRKPLMEATR